MKIPGSDSNTSASELANERARSAKVVARNTPAESGAASTAQSEGDSVQVSSLAAALRAELDPAKMQEERKQKIDDIKRRLKDGTYQPPLDKVATSLSQELSIEILLGSSQTNEDDGTGSDLL